jgi:regulator of sigma E protease
MCIITFISGSPTTTVGKLETNSPAVKAGLEEGDRLLKVNETKINKWEDVSKALKGTKEGQKIDIVVDRSGETKIITTSLMKSDDGRVIIGINSKLERGLGSAIVNGFKGTCSLTSQMYAMIKQLFTGQVPVSELSGPVGIVYVVNKSAAMGLMYFIYLMAMLSLNLAVVNLLPLPALDGGRIVLTVIRKITGKVITDEMEAKINLIGIVLLLTLMVYVTWNDIFKFIVPSFK